MAQLAGSMTHIGFLHDPFCLECGMQTLEIPDFYKPLPFRDDPDQLELAIVSDLLQHGAHVTHADKQVSFTSRRHEY